MLCPVCKATTSVIDSRQPEPHIVKRRRECTNGHRFTTWETAQNIMRSRERAKQKKKEWGMANRDKLRSQWQRDHLRRQAREEAAETGEDVALVYARWGITPPSSRKESLNGNQRPNDSSAERNTC